MRFWFVKHIFPCLLLLCQIGTAGEKPSFSRLPGVDPENVASIIQILKLLNFQYETRGDKIFIAQNQLAEVVAQLRLQGLIVYPELIWIPQQQTFIDAEDSNPAELPDGAIRLVLLDDITNPGRAEQILLNWNIFYQKKDDLIAVSVADREKVITKLKACHLFAPLNGVTYLIHTSPVFKDQADYETWVSQTEERRHKIRRETILLAVLRTEEIFEAAIIWDNETWQIRVLNPRNYQWSESLKRKIRTEIREFFLLLNEYGGEKIPPIEFKPSPAEETGKRPLSRDGFAISPPVPTHQPNVPLTFFVPNGLL